MSEGDQPLDKRTFFRGMAIIVAAIFLVGFVVVDSIGGEPLWEAITLLTSIFFLVLDSAISTNGYSRRVVNAIFSPLGKEI